MFSLYPASDVASYPLRWDLGDVKKWLCEQSNCKPNEVYEKIVSAMKEYIDFTDERHYMFVAVWIIGTYFHQIFRSYPFIYFGGLKKVGKTKTLRFIEMLAHNAVNSLSVSAPSLFRLCQGAASTLLIDETGYLSNRQRYEELRTLLYGRYKKGQTVQRVEKTETGRMYVQEYEVYGPTALANIEGLEDVLADRAIQIILLRTLNKKINDSEIAPEDERWQEIRNSLYRLYLVHWREVSDIYRKFSDVSDVSDLVTLVYKGGLLSGRSLELWRPLFALAQWIDVERQDKILGKLISLAEEVESERTLEDLTSTGESAVVSALQKMVQKDDWYPVKNVTAEAKANIDEAAEWLNTRWVGRCLRRLGFKEKRKMGTGAQYRMNPTQVADVCTRLGYSLYTNVTKSQTSQTSLKILTVCAKCAEENGGGVQLNQSGVCELCGSVGPLYSIEEDKRWKEI
jgi:hypothetical protein